MRRLIVEIPEKELIKVGIELPPVKKIKSLELLYFLKHDYQEFAAVSRVELRDSTIRVEDLLLGGLLVEAKVLAKEKNGAYIVYMRSGPSLYSILNSVGIESGFLFPPLGIGDGKVKFSFLGNEQQIKDFMGGLVATGIRYRVVRLTDANFSPISPLNMLTEKQREVLITAHKLGYYDIPRRITSKELAKKLGLVDSTVVEHLRKAEQRLITQIIEQ